MIDLYGLLFAYLIMIIAITLILYWFGFGYITAFIIGFYFATTGVVMVWDDRFFAPDTLPATMIATMKYFSEWLIYLWIFIVIAGTIFILWTNKLYPGSKAILIRDEWTDRYSDYDRM